MSLTPRQQRFVDEYLVDLNATKAAIRAGYSKKGATVRGSELLANRNVAEAIEAARTKVQERTEVTVDVVVKGLHEEATFYGEGSSHGARVSAWAHLGKWVGMFVDKHEHTGANGGPIEVRTVPDLSTLTDVELDQLEAIVNRGAVAEPGRLERGDPAGAEATAVTR